jgi:hypothetical protein
MKPCSYVYRYISRCATARWKRSFRRAIPHALQEPNQIRPTRPKQQTRLLRRTCLSNPSPNRNTQLACARPCSLSPRGSSGRWGAAAMRRTDDVECHDTEVGIAETTERVHSGVICFCERRVLHPRYGCTQGPRCCAEMAKEVAVVAGHVCAHTD